MESTPTFAVQMQLPAPQAFFVNSIPLQLETDILWVYDAALTSASTFDIPAQFKTDTISIYDTSLINASAFDIPVQFKTDTISIYDTKLITVSTFDIPVQPEIGIISIADLIPSINIDSTDIAVPFRILDNVDLVGSFPLTCDTFPFDIGQLSAPEIITIDLTLPKLRLFGMSYADKYWKEITDPSDTPKKNPSRSERTKTPGKRAKRSQETNGEEHDTLESSFWDLIFVVLKPPIILEDDRSIDFPGPLYSYQKKGVEFLTSNEAALLADDMGTGKTVMTVVALRILLQKATISKALILCPQTVLNEWRHHLETWTPDLESVFVRGTREKRGILWNTPAHVYVTTYDTLKEDIDKETLPNRRFGDFDVVILDEAHNVKNSSSKRARAVRKLRPRYRWALTGTPVQNRKEDLLAIFEFLRPPGFNPGPDPDPLYLQNAIQPYFLRRRKQDVLPDLPPKLRQEMWLELDDEQRALYDEAEARIRNEIIALGDNPSELQVQNKFNSSLNTLKQICNFAPNKANSPKLSLLKEQIEDVVASDNKIIVFTQYIGEGLHKIVSALEPYGVAKIEGEMSEKARLEQIQRFKRSANVHVLVASVRAAGEGLNLVEASYVVHFDHWWNPAVKWQAEDRAHRNGQRLSVNIYEYWMSDTIDERIHSILQQKGLLFESLIDNLADENVASPNEKISIEELRTIFGIPPKEKSAAQPPPSPSQLSLEEIRQRLLTVSPVQFEWLSKTLLERLGLQNVRVTGKSGDEGIDIIAWRNTDHGPESTAVQCKRWNKVIGPEVARGLVGAMQHQRCKKGILISSSDFSDGCLRFCELHDIRTISGLEFARYIKQFGLPL